MGTVAGHVPWYNTTIHPCLRCRGRCLHIHWSPGHSALPNARWLRVSLHRSPTDPGICSSANRNLPIIQDTNGTSSKDEYPPRAELRQLAAQAPLPVIAPGTLDPASTDGAEILRATQGVLSDLNAALATDDAEKLKACFFPGQAYWRDQLALTYHLRTFATPAVVAASLLETKRLRGLTEDIKLEGAPQFIPATPVLVRSRHLIAEYSSLDVSKLTICRSNSSTVT